MLVATAGHVDHGKTSPVQHLTGTNTDRLAEEKQRGLSIELGYAFRETGANDSIGFIDVPGHHRFINTMISGISGIDLAMLVVAADDGPMPQTLEHLQLLRLLGVERFAGVISKSDLVNRARLDQVANQISALIPGAPLCEISNRTGAGLDQLQLLLEDQSRECPKRSTQAQFRMYIDRVFIKKGAGLVVTGTCLSGSAKVGDELRLHTSAADHSQVLNVRVRDIHSQGKTATAGHAGQRCALNITGKVSLERVHRGDFLCAHPTAAPSHRLDTRCWTVDEPARSLKHLGRVKLYIGTRRMGARTYFLDPHENSSSGQRMQLILDKDVLAFAGDRFVIRNDNESTTLAGGIILDPQAPQWGKSRAGRLKQLAALERDNPELALEQFLFSNNDIVSLSRCKRTWNLSDAEIKDILETPRFNEKHTVRWAVRDEQFVASRALWKQYCYALEQALTSWHAARPMESGIKVDKLKILLNQRISGQLFKPVLDDCIRGGLVLINENRVHALGHRPTLSPQVQKDWQRLETYITQCELNLPLRSEIQKDTGMEPQQLEELVRPALKRGELYPIGEKRLALPATLQLLATLIKERCDRTGGFSVIEAKQMFGLGRNITIEILEFFDGIGYTKRKSESRVIADPDAAQLKLQGRAQC